MSETKAPTAETTQDAGTETALKNSPDPTELTAGNDAKKTGSKENENEADYTGEDNGKIRQRFFSQTEVNRIVKREIDRAIKSSKLPELEAAQAKVTDLESRLKQKELREQVTEAAARAGAKNAILLFRAVEEKLELDDKGKLKNLEDVLKNARRDYPELFRRDISGNANGGAGQQNLPQLSMNELLRRSRQ